ncbi:MAG: FAD-dependent oxidoreductase, partial [Pseudomonadota bacterium]
MQARLQACGLTLDLDPQHTIITQPSDFNALFPGSGGALYGRASHGWTASFARPGSKTKLPGLYLAGGSVHPGAGVPMATLSGMLAAQQIMKDRVST